LNKFRLSFFVVIGIRQFAVSSLLLCLAIASAASEKQVLPKRLPSAAIGLPPIGSLPDSVKINLAISLPLRNQARLTELLRELYDPASPQYRHYLTPAEFAGQFGPTVQDYEKLTSFVRSHHLTVRRTYPNRTLLDVSAKVEEIRQTFGVNLILHAHPTENRNFYAPDASPSMDAGVAVLAIKGLDDYFLPHPCGGPIPLGGTGYNGSYQGTNFRNAYVPGVTLMGSGQQVALVEFDGYYTNDITAYLQAARIPPVNLTNVSINGYVPPQILDPSGDGEVSLDIELVNSFAPGLSGILVYEQQFLDPTDDILNQIATDNLAKQISSSWYYQIDATSDQIFQQYAAQGQSFFSASGDYGAFPPGDISEPMDSAYITTTGGTTLSTSASGAWVSETVWNTIPQGTGDASGGGYTTNYPIPSWQVGAVNTNNGGSIIYRNTPDVACVANKVMVTYNNGKNSAFQGTSCAAPLWAAYTALVNQQAAFYGDGPVGFLNPSLYNIGFSAGYSTNFHDVTTGNNTNVNNPNGYFAISGFDLCTGWGTPNGSNLINTLAPPDTLVMLPVPGFASIGPGGGAFNVAAETFLLTNESSSSISWALQSDATWLSISATNGTLNPGATGSVEVSLSSDASNLFVGDYTGRLWLTNLTDGLLHQATFTLQVTNQLALSPKAGFEFAGPPSGPFDMAEQICQLTNASQNSVNWSVMSNPIWLDISPTNGVLGPYGSALVTCSLNGAATNLPTSANADTVVFSNDTFGATQGLPSLFLVGQLVQNGGFETGDFTDWTLIGDSNTTFVYNDPTVVHSGNYGVNLGSPGALTYLSQKIPTMAGASYSISFWLDSPDGLASNEFSVAWGSDILFDDTNLPAIGWTNLQFIVSANDSNTLLSIGGQNDQSYFGLDDVSVMAAPPTLLSIDPTNGPMTGGTTVSISGLGFQSQAKVAFGSLPATSITFNGTTNLIVITPPSTDAGPVDITITNADGQTAVLTNGFVFEGGTLVITWSNPPSITYGTPLDSNQLNASANVPGSFSYVPPSGTVLDAGTNLLSAIFTPNDSMTFSSATNYVTLAVLPAPLSVMVSNASRPYGVTNPPFGGIIFGLENGDNISATYSCAATPISPAGNYQISPSLLDPGNRLNNYNVSISNGTLTVLASVVPAFKNVALSSNTVSFDWNSTIGAAYQLQYDSSLLGTNWTNIGDLITATNATTSFSESITNFVRFYRVLQVPQ